MNQRWFPTMTFLLASAVALLVAACARSEEGDVLPGEPAPPSIVPEASTTEDAGDGQADDAGAEGGGSVSCVQNASSCPEGTVCVASDCRVGRCEPVTAGTVSARACGCDGIEYWNDTTAAGVGVTIRARRPCQGQEVRGCDPETPCPMLDTVCALDVGAMAVCNNRLEAGRCYRLPPTCPSDGPRVGECFGSQCTDQCVLLRTKKQRVINFYSSGACQ